MILIINENVKMETLAEMGVLVFQVSIIAIADKLLTNMKRYSSQGKREKRREDQ
jgi:hypothetical protein